jgi:hypothetical protein
MSIDQLARFIALFCFLVGWPAALTITFISTLVLVFGEAPPPPPEDPNDDYRE